MLFVTIILLAATAAAFLVRPLFSALSNSDKTRRAKRMAAAAVMEISLYRDNPRVCARAALRALGWSAACLFRMLPALLAAVIILLAVSAAVGLWPGRRPFEKDETAIVKAWARPGQNETATGFKLEVSENLRKETPPLLIMDGNEVNWRIRILNEDSAGGRVEITCGERMARRRVAISEKGAWNAAVFFEELFNLRIAGAILKTSVRHPQRHSAIGPYTVKTTSLFIPLFLAFTWLFRKRQ